MPQIRSLAGWYGHHRDIGASDALHRNSTLDTLLQLDHAALGAIALCSTAAELQMFGMVPKPLTDAWYHQIPSSQVACYVQVASARRSLWFPTHALFDPGAHCSIRVGSTPSTHLQLVAQGTEYAWGNV